MCQNGWSDQMEVDLESLTPTALNERMLAFEGLRRRLDAAEAATRAAWDAAEAWSLDGCQTGAAWLRGRRGAGRAVSIETMRITARLRSMPLTAAALAEGRVSREAVRILALARKDHLAEAFARSEEFLVDAAERFGADDLTRVVRHWVACADTDGATADAARMWAERNLSVVSTIDGVTHVAGSLDAEGGAIVAGELRALAKQLYVRDRAEQVADPLAPMRSHAQRWADALVEMATRSASLDGEARRTRSELTVVVDYPTLVADAGGSAQLIDGTSLTGDAVRRLACDAAYRRAVTLGTSELLDLGRSTPDPSAAQRAAVALRDGGCVWPGCDRRPSECDAHHLIPYGRGSTTGGPTNLIDLALLCRHHHRRVHDQHYTITRRPDGYLEFRRPDGTRIDHLAHAGPLQLALGRTGSNPAA